MRESLSRVTEVVCFLEARGTALAGLDENGAVISRSYAFSGAETWSAKHLDEVLTNDPLMGLALAPSLVAIHSGAAMPVPAALYDKQSADAVLRFMHALPSSDVVLHHHIPAADTWYVYALPAAHYEIVQRLCAGSAIIPSATPHFSGSRGTDRDAVYLTAGSDYAHATGWRGDKMLWHAVLDCSSAEDCAYGLVQYCTAHEMPVSDLHIAAASICPGGMLREISAYFPGIAYGEDNADPEANAEDSAVKSLVRCVS